MTLGGHESVIWDVISSPDSQAIVSGGDDRTVRLWDWERILLSHESEPQLRGASVVRWDLTTATRFGSRTYSGKDTRSQRAAELKKQSDREELLRRSL